jgi:CRP/FNR family transcriptional regulator, cyclic AMP receptor protein
MSKMPSLLDHCRGSVERQIAPGAVLLREGERSGHLLVLAEGTLEVYRGDVEVALVSEPGAVFGEMAVLLDQPHTASVRAVTDAKVHVIEDASQFLSANPHTLLPIATLLARRLQSATTYLVNLKQQFQDQKNHFGMVDEVLESLTHQQDESFPPVADLPDES